MAKPDDPLLSGLFLAGFECSSHRRRDGRRLDLLAVTGHDRLAARDYALLHTVGIRAARDGLRWHLIEPTPGRYDFGSFLPMLRAARHENVQVIWDLCHYGWPDDIDIWSGEFVDRFAAYAAAVARVVASESDGPAAYCPINEISYWAWAGGDTGRFNPGTIGRGFELKRQLVRATIAAIDAVRAVDPRARFITAEPLINVEAGIGDDEHNRWAAHFHQAQFEATDMIAGRLEPDLGGAPQYLDILGVNYYPDNQWYHNGPPIPLGHHAYRPLRALLAEAHDRYGRPLLMSETGAEGTARSAWLSYIGSEVRAATANGVPIEGICLYPVVDYVGWDNDRVCDVGLFSPPDADGNRKTCAPMAEELNRQITLFREAAEDPVPEPDTTLEPPEREIVRPDEKRAPTRPRLFKTRPREQTRAAPPFMRGPLPFIRHYIAAHPLHVGGLLALVIAAASAGIGSQYVMKLLVDSLAGIDGTAAVWIAVALFIGLISLESVLWRLTGWLGCRTSLGVGVHVRVDLFDHINGQPMRYFAENLAGALGQRITATAGNFGALINTSAWRITPPLVDFVGTTVIFFLIDWRLAVVLAVYVTAVTGALIVYGERGRRYHRAYAQEAGVAAGELVDVITNMWAVKAFSARESERRRLLDLFQRESGLQRRSWMYTEQARVIHDVALVAMAASVLSFAVYIWSQGRVTPGEVVVITTLTFRMLNGSRDLALALVDGSQQIGFIDETLRVIAQPQTVVDVPRAPALPRRDGEIVFDNVSFAYGEGRDAVHKVSFTIPAGQKVGIVGPSGAGKSTITHLIQRLYDVQGGDIRIGGQSIAAVTQDSLRSALAVVPQEIVLFHRSVRDNILFAKPDATEEEVVLAAEAAAADGFIRRLPQGYDTVVGERGTRLSGGQRQRIGIARAFLKDAPIIVLDEATSALDTESELEIQRALVEHMSGRTVIAVAHRLSTLAAFDRVLVIADGRIVEDGAPAELRRRGGVFERMWRRQAGGLATPEELDRAA